ncbi:hypothetical protein [Microbacterium sp. T2.11-28]|uniref:hypothetical protein n=1 Tax=Microbacterium sp. T2.11-28 TaxID=3041169 RepID=UPI0024773D92|nr:hypothetical protein [Microbacterium sp. T2.11-28]CAI9392551.1 hypothetical protein MICABA_02146 [Microbacterium sp. T2.11-28]
MLAPGDPLPPPPDRAADFADDFAGPLSEDRWVAHYLPQWTTPERSAARCRAVARGIELRIEADQPDWRPEDAPLRVSNLQTGMFSGPLGSDVGTHRHRPDGVTVRTPVPTRLLFAPSAGRVEIDVSASRDLGCMTAAWLIGTEHRTPAEAGEICVFEIDAEAIGAGDRVGSTRARVGIKAHGDSGLTTDMAAVSVPVDAGRRHTWTVIWGDGETIVGCEGVVVRVVPQAPDYPLFLMLDVFEVAPPAGRYPKSAVFHAVRGWEEPPARPAS